MFSVSIDKQHRTFLSVQYSSDLKKVLSMEILVSMIISKLVGKPSCFEHTEGRLVVLKFPCYMTLLLYDRSILCVIDHSRPHIYTYLFYVSRSTCYRYSPLFSSYSKRQVILENTQKFLYFLMLWYGMLLYLRFNCNIPT